MSSDTLHTIISLIEQHTGKKARQGSNGFRTVCPGHDGKNYSLFLSDDDTRVQMHCHSHGCDPKVILESIGLSIKDVFYENLDPIQKKAISEKKLIKELLTELAVVAFWANDKLKGKYPRIDADRFRIKQAMNRVKKGLNYLEANI